MSASVNGADSPKPVSAAKKMSVAFIVTEFRGFKV